MSIDAAVNRVRRTFRRLVPAVGVVVALAPAAADAIFLVEQPWARPAAKSASTEAFMVITSTDGAVLAGVRSEFARSVVIVAPGAGVQEVASLALPAGVPVPLAPGAYRLRLTKLDRALRLGERVPIVLTIEDVDGKRQEIPVSAEVRRRSPIDDERRPHHH